jgi:hypothetical protein
MFFLKYLLAIAAKPTRNVIVQYKLLYLPAVRQAGVLMRNVNVLYNLLHLPAVKPVYFMTVQYKRPQNSSFVKRKGARAAIFWGDVAWAPETRSLGDRFSAA